MNNFDSKLSECLHAERLPFKESKQDAWLNVSARIDDAPVISINKAATPKWKWAAAAGAAIVLALGASYYAGQESHFNETAFAQKIALSDGSVVTLKPEGKVAYNAVFWPVSRIVKMEGEAFYEVIPGNAFSVRTKQGVVRVLGTSFNVRTRNHDLDVQCKTGRVAVDYNDQESVVLNPGEAFQVALNDVSKYAVPAHRIGAWINGPYQFEEASLAQVLGVISEDFGYELDIRDGTNLKYTGSFSREEELRDMMEIVCKPLGLDFHIDHDKRLISISK